MKRVGRRVRIKRRIAGVCWDRRGGEREQERERQAERQTERETDRQRDSDMNSTCGNRNIIKSYFLYSKDTIA